ncbi:hypothetical protein BKA81DRAFT_375701 [Phyllosticta paracitricarpa]|uniref:Uncharacterized protein n=1 Tax=Phyllosticta citricarpa TaxID=55181 RepID=A0ABR1MH55_9PEZI
MRLTELGRRAALASVLGSVPTSHLEDLQASSTTSICFGLPPPPFGTDNNISRILKLPLIRQNISKFAIPADAPSASVKDVSVSAKSLAPDSFAFRHKARERRAQACLAPLDHPVPCPCPTAPAELAGPSNAVTAGAPHPPAAAAAAVAVLLSLDSYPSPRAHAVLSPTRHPSTSARRRAGRAPPLLSRRRRNFRLHIIASASLAIVPFPSPSYSPDGDWTSGYA